MCIGLADPELTCTESLAESESCSECFPSGNWEYVDICAPSLTAVSLFEPSLKCVSETPPSLAYLLQIVLQWPHL